MVTPLDIQTYLSISVSVLLIVVLYHILFVAVDLRKILRRFEDVTKQVENVIMKPLSMTDQILEFILERIEFEKKKSKVKKVSSTKKK